MMIGPNDPPEELDIPDNQEEADSQSVQNLLDWPEEEGNE